MANLTENLISNSCKSDSWYDDFAEKLLSENFLLTALEFYAELTESGKELPKLRDFFSNPGNFEKLTVKPDITSLVNLPRSSSQATLDSLDLTRYSEDGERNYDDKVAVLEFELRKARETINALRANLTEAAESESNQCRLQEKNLQDSEVNFTEQKSIKPHEQRALNFLINEYLLLNGYKLTSITFADENESQDFEDWNDVGLNCARPLELLYLYRNGFKSVGCLPCIKTSDFECQVTLYDEIQQTLHVNELESQIVELSKQIHTLKTEFSNKTVGGHEIIGEDSQRSLTPDPEYFEIIGSLKNKEDSETKSEKSLGDWTNIVEKEKRESLDLKYDSQSYSESISNDGKIENQLEMFINEENDEDITGDIKKKDQNLIRNDIESSSEIKNVNFTKTEFYDFGKLLDEANVSASSADQNSKVVIDLGLSSREVPESFRSIIFKHCDMVFPTFSDDDILTAWFQKSCFGDLTIEHLLEVLSLCLPKIIPNIILNKREEIIPLLVLSACFNPDGSIRDKLLHLLFNLKKKPDVEERKVILKGLLIIAKFKGPSMVENEILPQGWEQITHKYLERRMLVAESCLLLAPYVSETIRNSLIISITQQLLQDREESVRKAAISILAILITLMSDENKYLQVLDICIQLLDDESIKVGKSVTQLLLPILAQWSFTLNKIHTHLFPKLLKHLKKKKTLFVCSAIETLLPYLVMTIANSKFLLELSSDRHPPPSKREEFSFLCKGLCNPALFFNGSVSKVMGAFDFYTSEANFSLSEWPELEWVLQVFIPQLLENGDNCTEDSKILKSLMSILRYLCLGLGRNVTNFKVKPYLLEKLIECENAIVSGQECKYAIIPLYLVGVLSTYPEELQEMSNTLRRFICAFPLCGVSLTPLQVTVEILSQNQTWQILVLDAIWEGVIHQRSLVRSGSAVLLNSVIPNIPDALLSTKILPALVTLTSDPEISVKINAVPALGMLVSAKEKAIKDKVCMTFQTLFQDGISVENVALVTQLIKTITNFYEQCDRKFKDEVVVPQLCAITTLAGKIKSKDLIEALINLYSAVTYSQTQVPSHRICSNILSGLRILENVCSQLSLPFSEHVDSLIKEVERRLSGSKESSEKLSKSSPSSEAKKFANAVSSHMVVEDVKNRVTKIFNSRPNSLQNVSGIFKKKI